jgi:hypothetical protein
MDIICQRGGGDMMSNDYYYYYYLVFDIWEGICYNQGMVEFMDKNKVTTWKMVREQHMEQLLSMIEWHEKQIKYLEERINEQLQGDEQLKV